MADTKLATDTSKPLTKSKTAQAGAISIISGLVIVLSGYGVVPVATIAGFASILSGLGSILFRYTATDKIDSIIPQSDEAGSNQ